MKSQSFKVLKGALGGLFAVCLLSLACAPALAGYVASSSMESTVSTKVAVNNMPVGVSDVAECYAYPEYEFEKLKISPSYQHLKLQPGSEESFTVSLENKDNKTITLKPETVITPYTDNFVNEDWISISPSEKALSPGETAEFEVKVRVPKTADLGNYALVLAFTENVPEGDVAGYSNFPGTMHLNFEVYIPPTVQVLTSSIADLVKAGQSYEYEIELKNIGKKDITLSPELTDNGYGPVFYDSIPYGETGQAFGNEALSIEGPEKIKAGETAVVKLKLKVPSDAKGRYNGNLNLNLDDPGIRDYEGKVYLNFRILPNPEKPYVTTFASNTNGPITIDVQSSLYNYGLYNSEKTDRTPSFKVSLKDPSGKTVEPALAGMKYSNSVSINTDSYPMPYPMPLKYAEEKNENRETSEEDYQCGSTTYVESYIVPGSAGEWTLSILPENVENFEYSISIRSSLTQ